ncbi:hypothetical protein Tco_0867062 [Tanacetum coccineum]
MNSGDDVRSGGKVVKKRRLATGKTPYDRPEPPQDKEQEKGNWIKYVTGGASRLVSSIWSYSKWGECEELEDNHSDSVKRKWNDDAGDYVLKLLCAMLVDNKLLLKR